MTQNTFIFARWSLIVLSLILSSALVIFLEVTNIRNDIGEDHPRVSLVL